jgi:hypothetical protein
LSLKQFAHHLIDFFGVKCRNFSISPGEIRGYLNSTVLEPIEKLRNVLPKTLMKMEGEK